MSVYPATILVLSALAIMLTIYWLGYEWARRHGQFEDIEAAKFRMLENERQYHDEKFRQPIARR